MFNVPSQPKIQKKRNNIQKQMKQKVKINNRIQQTKQQQTKTINKKQNNAINN
jgi:hypothetical protein